MRMSTSEKDGFRYTDTNGRWRQAVQGKTLTVTSGWPRGKSA